MYKGTFKQAYNILTEMTAKIGWDQLLKIRSTVFVMEDEYRTEKQEATNRNPSTDGLRGTPDQTTNGDDESGDDEDSKQKAGETESTAETVTVNGEDSTVEKPTHAIDPGEVKADGESVSKVPGRRMVLQVS